MIVHVIGASGRSGTALCRALSMRGTAFVPVVRSLERWQTTGLAGDAKLADIEEPAQLKAALAGASYVVSCAHARHAAAILAASPAASSFVFLGSTRKFTRWPDQHGRGVLAGEAAFIASGRTGVILHPTMIYGAKGEDNVQRLAALLKRLPVVPLPEGGRALVQPIYQDDVTASILAALNVAWHGAESLVIAGADAVPYAQFVREVARAAGLPSPRLLSLPASALMLAASLTRFLPLFPTIGRDEVKRLMEDKAFDIAPMMRRLGIQPLALRAGLCKSGLHASFEENAWPAAAH